jgi:phosphatidate cytidylyltransferase
VAKRIFSTVILWALVGTTLWFFRTTGALVLIGLISVLTLREFYLLMQGAGYTPFHKLGLVFGGLLTMAPWAEAQYGRPDHLLLALATVVFAVRLLGERQPENRVESLASTIVGLVYVSLLLGYFVRIVTPTPGDTITANGRLLLALWLIMVAKFCDMGALLSGMAFGKHKMSPQISPKKTWEGAIGGVILSMVSAGVFAWCARGTFPAHMTPLVASLMAAPLAVLAIVSDLIESVIKRRANIKDSGQVVPGIGGMFDLSDSLILAAPLGSFLFGLP